MGSAAQNNIGQLFEGTFITPANEIAQKAGRINAYIFDWDGVFNTGAKSADGSSSFNEVDSMGINMLRYNHYMRKGFNPLVAIITGENNPTAFAFAKREHFHGVYYGIKNKRAALEHLCASHDIAPEEIAFFYDDIVDLEVASLCGVRMMAGRQSSPVLRKLVTDNKLADYITSHSGGNYAIREATELLMYLNGQHDETMLERSRFSESYRDYLNSRNIPVTSFYTAIDQKITEKNPL